MSSFQRLPEPTTIPDTQLKGYFNQLLRVLKFNFNNINTVLNGLIESTTVTRAISTDSSNTTINTTAYQWNGDTDSAGFAYTLPAGVQGTEYKIVNVGTSGNTLEVAPNGSENLIGANSSTNLSDGEFLIIAYDATNGWY